MYTRRQSDPGREAAPMGRFRNEVDRLMERFFGSGAGPSPRSWRDSSAPLVPRLDADETAEAIRLRVELPGVKQDQVDIEVAEGHLTVRGEKHSHQENSGHGYRYCESEFGTFSRTIPVPPGVDEKSIEASFDDGVLSITIRKPPESMPKRVRVGNGGHAPAGTDSLLARRPHEERSSDAGGVRTIAKEELNEKLRRNERVQVVNVLEKEHFGLGLIRGSKRIPLSELDRRMNELDRNVPVVVYCGSAECPLSRRAAEKLSRHGFDVRPYEGGITEWKEAGLPTE